MKIIGLIFIISGAGLIIYSMFLPKSVKSEDSVDKRIEALNNTDISLYGLIILTIGILIRQGLWSYNRNIN